MDYKQLSVPAVSNSAFLILKPGMGPTDPIQVDKAYFLGPNQILPKQSQLVSFAGYRLAGVNTIEKVWRIHELDYMSGYMTKFTLQT